MPASTAVPCCPNRHALKPFVTPHDRFNCDLCGDDQPKGIDMRGCRICEHDVCGKCSPPVDVPLDVADADAEIVEVCPSGHPLEPFAMEDEFGECDLCGCDQPEDAPMRSCRICDFDVCQSCTANLAPRPRAAAVPPVPVVERSDDIRKPAIDGRSYRYVKLPNELRIVLVSDGEADKAAASLDVAVGHAWLLGGASNAYTAFENTNYHFEVLPAHLPGALDRFAQFFIAPLFTESGASRERPPLAIRDALFAFHQRHYSANAMRLCVVGKQSLAELEQLLRLLTVLWPMPPIRQLWRSKPHRYISHLLGHESEGSLLSLLKGRGWVDSLCAGESVSASDFAMFEVQMALSEEGDGKARWVFEECSSLAEMGFRYKEQDEPMDAANSLATSLEHHPPADVLSAPYLHQEFDPAAIEAMLALLTPARVITLHSSRCVAAAAPYREPWYNTPFGAAHASVGPRLLAGVELWHKTDATFRRPKTNMWMALQLSQAYATPLKVVMTSLFTRQLSDELTEFSYHAEAPDLAAERFAIQRDNAPYQHAVYLASVPLARVLLEVRRHHILDYYREVVESGSLDLDEYRAFAGEMVAAARAAIGSKPLSCDERRECESMYRALVLPADSEVWVRQHPSTLPEDQRLLANADETNSAIEVFLQAGVLHKCAEQQLRTVEQLGYIVWCTSRFTYNTVGLRSTRPAVGLRFIIQSAVASPTTLDERIEALPRVGARPAAWVLLLSSWHEMTPLQQYDFDRNERDAEAVRALTQPQLAAFWDATLSRASGAQQQAPFRACVRRKASFQVFAPHLELPPPPDGVVCLDTIEAVQQFKKSLSAWPGVHEEGGGGDSLQS
ncbi:insulin degrading metallo proteinase [Emiliania huxleyi CCMP1516]|uniref:ZZ-type domain-containing protein n=2 Tax=Emiliania huxleyi TaxID=2903 RepID=A0A0D3L230_EMIH1|nr:insulin degrading metallo proteinase [Emiliania huxleyi CCMP1516]EOD42065.1 insulin degrading metallo proteinase [Emiliania huxleyi CCMP1516]|eukprot:XP_005794494.1 insulin degrading metallo proteinase [Emiliania huxleyi CCMP1516]